VRPPYRESGITKLSDEVYVGLIFQLALAIRLADVAHEDWDDKISNTDRILKRNHLSPAQSL